MKRILIVDDDLSTLNQLSSQLRGESYELMLAKSGDMALQICVEEKPDLVLLDVQMPEMDGFEVISRIKRTAYFANLPVIFLTASSDPEVQIRALELGARDFIVKPAEKSVLMYRINLHLRFCEYQTEAERNVAALSDSIAFSFAEMIERRDENTGGHVMRTSKYVEILGSELMARGLFPYELGPASLRLMVRAAPLHDIGKIAISDRILLKPGRLDDEEFAAMKLHSAKGAEILRFMHERMPTQDYLYCAALIAGSHHERYDGKGYPAGLSGNDIPLAGRIMAVADVFDALIDSRVYRSGMGHAEAGAMILKGEGTQFDPEVVAAFRNTRERILEFAAANAEARHG